MIRGCNDDKFVRRAGAGGTRERPAASPADPIHPPGGLRAGGGGELAVLLRLVTDRLLQPPPQVRSVESPDGYLLPRVEAGLEVPVRRQTDAVTLGA